MATLITGSFAFDTIMVFQDQFKNHILPDQVHILNVCFFVPEMRKEFGGCSGNIAYNLNMLGGNPVPMGTVGEDFAPYRNWLNKCGINDQHVVEIPETYTAQAFLTTDTDNNQIIAFHPGAMNEAHQNKVTDPADITLGIVAPDGRDAMIQHSEQFADNQIPFIFDPGQGLPMFDGTDLKKFIDEATYVVVNDYESEMLQDKTGLTLEAIAKQVETLIVTRGGKGSEIFTEGSKITIPSISVKSTTDPTGCGDAYRAGLLFGMERGMDWETCGQMASLIGGIKIEHHGTQNHFFTQSEFQEKYEQHFAQSLDL